MTYKKRKKVHLKNCFSHSVNCFIFGLFSIFTISHLSFLSFVELLTRSHFAMSSTGKAPFLCLISATRCTWHWLWKYGLMKWMCGKKQVQTSAIQIWKNAQFWNRFTNQISLLKPNHTARFLVPGLHLVFTSVSWFALSFYHLSGLFFQKIFPLFCRRVFSSNLVCTERFFLVSLLRHSCLLRQIWNLHTSRRKLSRDIFWSTISCLEKICKGI